MPRSSRRVQLLRRLRRNLTQRQSLLAMSMLNDDSSSSGSDAGNSSSSSDSTTDAIIYAAGCNEIEDKLDFAERSRYLFRGRYRKSDEQQFIRDLNPGNNGERPWLTDEEFKQEYRMSRDALNHIAEKIKDDKAFKNKRGPKQMNPKHQLMVLLQYLGTEGSGASSPRQRAYLKIGKGSANNYRRRVRDAIIRTFGEENYYWPDENERREIAAFYKREFDLPNCVAVMDGTLLPLEFEPQTRDAGDYHGRKFQWSLTCLVIRPYLANLFLGHAVGRAPKVAVLRLVA
ncbi:hypothetical protein ACHAWC_010180 [Mediolabrus comicus]